MWKLFEIWEENQVTNEGLVFLIKLIENFEQRELFEILMRRWTERDFILSSEYNSQSAKERKLENFQKVSFESNAEDNISSFLKETILWDVFTKMNSSESAETRTLAAYAIWVLTFKHFHIQSEIWRYFGFTPMNGVVIINQFPVLIVEEDGSSLKNG